MGRLYLRYQSHFGFAERWAAAEISQIVRVLPDLEQARQQALFLIRSRQIEMEKRRRRHEAMAGNLKPCASIGPGTNSATSAGPRRRGATN